MRRGFRLDTRWLTMVCRMTDVSEVRYWWHEASVPAELQITQVYGWLLCPQTGRVLVQDDEGVFNLTGVRAGSPVVTC
jgi:hypothetical protein